MKGVVKFIVATIVVVVVLIGGILAYQTWGVSHKEGEKDALDIANEKSANAAADTADIFD